VVGGLLTFPFGKLKGKHASRGGLPMLAQTCLPAKAGLRQHP
jgi:hypothetical protein